MDELAINTLSAAATTLTELIAKGAAGVVQTKIATMKNKKEAKELTAGYESIISMLLEEREQAIRVAQVYKEEVDRMTISDEDIQELNSTLSSVISLLNTMASEDKKMDTITIDTIKGLISKDTLKTMQLLGFNYKKAIGEPLTNACANYISTKLKTKNTNNQKR